MSDQEVRVFNLDDPELSIDVPEDYDPQAELAAQREGFPPPPDRVGGKRVPYLVTVKLIEPTEQKPDSVYFKNGQVLAACKAQFVKEDGTPGMFLKNWYPSTRVGEYQKTSAIAYICKQQGQPLSAVQRHPNDIIKHVKAVFEAAGEAGVQVTVHTQWIKSIKDANGQYVETKGSAAIAQTTLAAAQHASYEAGLGEEETAAALVFAQNNPHLYTDESGEQRSVRSEVVGIVGA